jgi:hypothetical protein
LYAQNMAVLDEVVQSRPLADTHEHMKSEEEWTEEPCDIVRELFESYLISDIHSARLTEHEVRQLFDPEKDLKHRYPLLEKAWARTRISGYGEAAALAAEAVFGLKDISLEGLEDAQVRLAEVKRRGERRRIIGELGNISHIQVDAGRYEPVPDTTDPAFFLHDISMVHFISGVFDLDSTREVSGVEVNGIDSLGQAIDNIFARLAPTYIAIKSQHAYNRTLEWHSRSDREAEAVLNKRLEGVPDVALTEAERLCLGDWCFERAVKNSIEHHLPFKIHTGYYAAHGHMHPERITPSHLASIMRAYPEARFVLMHIGYPFWEEAVAMAKHFPNGFIDMCWAWSVNPLASARFLQSYLHAAPTNKLFVFGGDTFRPTNAVGYALQCRRWLYRALREEVDEMRITEADAIDVAERIMHGNQDEVFDLEGTRAALADALA